jgi:hypothetical protein
MVTWSFLVELGNSLQQFKFFIKQNQASYDYNSKLKKDLVLKKQNYLQSKEKEVSFQLIFLIQSSISLKEVM